MCLTNYAKPPKLLALRHLFSHSDIVNGIIIYSLVHVQQFIFSRKKPFGFSLDLAILQLKEVPGKRLIHNCLPSLRLDKYCYVCFRFVASRNTHLSRAPSLPLRSQQMQNESKHSDATAKQEMQASSGNEKHNNRSTTKN